MRASLSFCLLHEMESFIEKPSARHQQPSEQDEFKGRNAKLHVQPLIQKHTA